MLSPKKEIKPYKRILSKLELTHEWDGPPKYQTEFSYECY